MHRLDEIAEQIHQAFEVRTSTRDKALTQARTLTRYCADTIRAVHRNEFDLAKEHLDRASALAKSFYTDLEAFPDLYYAGYTQDALKEYAEASIVYALVNDKELPSPQDLGLENATYLNGLAETVGEFRRRCLDILRQGYSKDAELLLQHMDDIYAVLITMDYPNAITGGIRRQTDIARSIIERTRGDLTLSLRQEHLEQSMQRLEGKIKES
ncbi:MAG: haloacid dehalogenase [Chloroflexota bacterium]|jgi:translin|nr:MAG: haloacid dehalogenase [Chloroflexota bacterium]UCF28707.1 MAG: haloacid dehalogenase [Chloroflexota bacterium]